MPWARIQDGVAREIINFDPLGRFHPSLTWVKCDETVKERMLYDGKQFLPEPPVEKPVPREDPVIAELKARIAILEKG